MAYQLIRMIPKTCHGRLVCEGALIDVARCGLSMALTSYLAKRHFPHFHEALTSEETNVLKASSIMVLEGNQEDRMQIALYQLNHLLEEADLHTYVIQYPPSS